MNGFRKCSINKVLSSVISLCMKTSTKIIKKLEHSPPGCFVNRLIRGLGLIKQYLGLYSPKNFGHVQNLGLNFATGRNFKKYSNVRNFMMSVLRELELRV